MKRNIDDSAWPTDIQKGKQLFILHRKLGDLIRGCLAWYNGCQSQFCPALVRAGQAGRRTASMLKVSPRPTMKELIPRPFFILRAQSPTINFT